MFNYRLIATDLDGTLLRDDGSISKENLDAIEKLSREGVNIVLSTGRTLCEIPSALRNNPNIKYLIGSNGAAVWDFETKDKIISLEIPKSVFCELFEVLRDYRVNITYRCNGQSYVDKRAWKPEDMKFYNICLPHEKAIKTYAVFLEDFAAAYQDLENIETFALFFHSAEEMAECEKRLLKNKELSVVRAWDSNLEVFHNTSGKGNALKKLAEYLNIKIEKTVAVGDSNNDLSMIKAAGLGLCVSNGAPNLKALSHRVICSNQEHIMKYISEEEL